MFHALEKEHAENAVDQALKQYRESCDRVVKHSDELYSMRKVSVKTIQSCNEYLQELKNCTMDIARKEKEIRKEYQTFEKEREKAEKLTQKKDGKIMDKALDVGAAAGAGASMFGADALIAMATTFGTTTTGTVIGTLHGAAATNAILAWLGGSAGVAGGSALISLISPIGLGLCAACLIAKGAKVGWDNKHQAERSEKNTKKLMESKKAMDCADKEMISLIRRTKAQNKMTADNLAAVKKIRKNDYQQFSRADAEKLLILLNNAQTLSEMLTVNVAVKN